MANQVTAFMVFGLLGTIVNLVVSYFKKWELLFLMTVVATFVVLTSAAVIIFVNPRSFLFPLLAFVGILSILAMTTVSVTLAVIQTLLGLGKS